MGQKLQCEKCGRTMDEIKFYTYKDGSKLYKCKEYKTNLKCPASIKMKGDKVLEISSNHNHAKKEDKVIFGGRLGMYQYFDMWQVIDEALKLVYSLK